MSSNNNEIPFEKVQELLDNNEEEPKITEIKESENINKKVTIDESKNEEKEIETQKPQKTFEQLLKDYLKENQIKILFSTITNSSNVNIGYYQSMLQMATQFSKYDIDFDIVSIQNEDILSRGKNCVIAKLLSDKSYTHLMFIDTNITFSWKNICELIMSNKHISGGAYPKRNINYTKMTKIISTSKEINKHHLLAKSMDYHFNPTLYEEKLELTESEKEEGKPSIQQKINVENNMIEVKTMNSGFMLFKREALELMADKLGLILKFNNNYNEYTNEELKEHFYSFFERERTDNGYLDEDEVFCKRWQKCGGKLWIGLLINLNATYTTQNNGSLYLSVVENN